MAQPVPPAAVFKPPEMPEKKVKLSMQALQEFDAMSESTRAPSTVTPLKPCVDGEDSDDSIHGGQQFGKSNSEHTSKSNNSKKGPKRRAKNEARALAFMESRGIKPEFKTAAEKAAANMAASSKPGESLSVGSLEGRVRANDKDFAPMGIKERMVNYWESFAKAFELPNVKPDPEEIRRKSPVLLKGTLCTCCLKQWGYGHPESAMHMTRASVAFALDKVLGLVCHRTIYGGLPLRGAGDLVTKTKCRKFWGPDVEHLGSKAILMLQAKGFLQVKTSAKKHTAIGAESVVGGAVAMVPYKGCGQYDEQGATYIRWPQIPNGETDGEAEEEELEEMADELGVQRWRAEQTWWPVVLWSTKKDDAAVSWLAGTDYATCIYQLIDDGPMYAWPVQATGWALD